MLTLESPVFEFDGITVFRDHAVADQFYYLAPQPQLARVNGRPMFDLFAYAVELRHSPLSGTSIPDELGAGFLNLGVACPLSEAQRDHLRDSLAARLNRDAAGIILLPVPYHKGTVRVLALDKFSVPAEPTGDPRSEDRLKGRPTFVEEILGAATPGLFGDLRTIFSLKLSQAGVTFLEALYQDRAAPVGIVYELKFYGLRPAVEAVIRADLARIYHHFGGRIGGQIGGGYDSVYLWAKADVSAALDFLKEQSAIEIRLTSQATGEAAEKSKELALSLFKDRIIQEMFRPSTPQLPASLGGNGTALGAEGSVGLSLKFQRSEDLKTLEYSFAERSPEERTHCPQAFLALLASKSEIAGRIHHVDLDGDFFETLDVLVTGPSKEEFESLRIRQVEATLTYGESGDPVPPESRALLFRPDSTGDKSFSVKRRGRKSLAYRYSLVYEFISDPALDSESQRLELIDRSATSRTLLINPTNDFGVLKVEVEPGRIDPSIRQVDVALLYKARGGQFAAEQKFRIDRTTAAPPPRLRWQVRTRDRDIAPYQAVFTFVFDEGAQFTAPPVTSTEPLLQVDSPFRHLRRLFIKPHVLSQNITQITVEIEYEDSANGYKRSLFVSLLPPFDSKDLSWPIIDAEQQLIRYRATVHEAGFISEGEWQESDSASIIVGGPVSRIAAVSVRLVGGSLADAGLDALMVKLQLALSPPDSAEPVSLLFEPGGPLTQETRLTLPPAFNFKYRFQTVAFKRSGDTVESAWKEETNRLLVISTRNV